MYTTLKLFIIVQLIQGFMKVPDSFRDSLTTFSETDGLPTNERGKVYVSFIHHITSQAIIFLALVNDYQSLKPVDSRYLHQSTAMPETKTYRLPPTPLIPNSPRPLIHYRNLFPSEQDRTPTTLHHKFASNGWSSQWIWRYGKDQTAHYHSAAHECMVVLTGSARIRFGVADVHSSGNDDASSPEDSTDTVSEEGGVEVEANAGDVFILPAGTAHKTFNTLPEASLKLLTPGNGHAVDVEGLEKAGSELEGFTMMGAYPVGSEWDFSVGGESEGVYQRVWEVAKPERDPILGDGEEGLCGLW